MPAVAEWLRRAYPALLERAGVGSIPANSDAQDVPSFRRWRFEMKLGLFFLTKQKQNKQLKGGHRSLLVNCPVSVSSWIIAVTTHAVLIYLKFAILMH